jgi:NAD(P)-dependent dehydrogenase (short-subunit alcohol dehydrogenase family)
MCTLNTAVFLHSSDPLDDDGIVGRVRSNEQERDVAKSIMCDEGDSSEALRAKLAEFYAQRTTTRRPILPQDCANAICWLAGDQSATTTGHVIPVDGGLPEAFLR